MEDKNPQIISGIETDGSVIPEFEMVEYSLIQLIKICICKCINDIVQTIFELKT